MSLTILAQEPVDGELGTPEAGVGVGHCYRPSKKGLIPSSLALRSVERGGISNSFSICSTCRVAFSRFAVLKRSGFGIVSFAAN